jgi:hypothetical protein
LLSQQFFLQILCGVCILPRALEKTVTDVVSSPEFPRSFENFDLNDEDTKNQLG